MSPASGAAQRADGELLGRIRSLVRDELYPLEPLLLQGRFAELVPRLEEVRARVKERGLWAPHLPRDYGGLGLGLADFGRVSEELGRSPLGHYAFNCQAPDIGNMELLLAHGTPEQRERWLLPLARGEIRSCFAMTEPEHAGSNPVHLSTTARREGDEYVIDGGKWFTTAAEGAAFAVVMAVTDPTAERPHQRASQILVPTDTPGYELVRNTPDHGRRGRGLLQPRGGALPRLPGPDREPRRAAGRRLRARPGAAGPGPHPPLHALDRHLRACARPRSASAPPRASSRPAAPSPSSRPCSSGSPRAAPRSTPPGSSSLDTRTAHRRARGARAARVQISAIKFLVAGVLQRVLDRAVQIHGGLGMTDDTPLAHWYRHERAARIYDGPDEVHKSVVARQVLKPYGVRVTLVDE